MVSRTARILTEILLSGSLLFFAAGCSKDDISTPDNTDPKEHTDDPQKPETPPVFPEELHALAHVYIDTPKAVPVTSKKEWITLATIKITGDGGAVLFEEDSLKIRGRGNSTWKNYPKKPYYIKLDHQANFFGTGKSKRWVLLPNWMDRTLLRNDVAFEAARRTSLAWNPSGEFVELYLNGTHLGNYWLGEKINVEGSKFEADYLYSIDSSDASECDFTTTYGYRYNDKQPGLPTEVKYPDRDDNEYEKTGFGAVLSAARTFIDEAALSILKGDFKKIDLDSFCDWYLVYELCGNLEPRHPKSCFFYAKGGKLYAGPVWDFDWGTFQPTYEGLLIDRTLWFASYDRGDASFAGLFSKSAFKKRLKERWKALKPKFETLGQYVDARAEKIRESEAVNHEMWPCYPNPFDASGKINQDEDLSFDEAVARLKESINLRISQLDTYIQAL